MAQPSGTERFLKGKTIPGMTSPVKEVLRHGEKRRVILNNGETIVYSKEKMMQAFNSTLKREQGIAALKTIRENRDTVSVNIGGVIKGERKQYKTLGAAKGAITRAYGKI